MANYGDGIYGGGPYGGGVDAGTNIGPIITLPVGYYTGLLTSEYQGSTNLLAWLSAVLAPISDIAQCSAAMPNNFDLDVAVGAQLDILGVILGQGRTVSFQPSNSASPVLDDDTYRILLKATIAQNQWDGTIDGLQGTWQDLFPGGQIVIQDNQDMTATVLVTGPFSSIIQDLITNGYIVPRPQGVKFNIVYPQLPVFGLDANSAFISGLDGGHWT